MKTGKCPKCGSTDVHSGSDIMLKSGPFNCNAIPVSMTSVAALDNFVCAECGLVESYIADESKRKEIARKWPKLDPDAAPSDEKA